MAVPIRTPQGKVIGALVGVVDLSLPNFLDSITENTYGKTGGYLIVAPQYRLIITGSDKRRIMMRRLSLPVMIRRYCGATIR